MEAWDSGCVAGAGGRGASFPGLAGTGRGLEPELEPELERGLAEVRASASASARVGVGVGAGLGGRVVDVAAGAGAGAGGTVVGRRTVEEDARRTCVRGKGGAPVWCKQGGRCSMRAQVVVPVVPVVPILGLGRGCGCPMAGIGIGTGMGWVGHILMYGGRARGLCSRSSGSRLGVEPPTC